MNTEELCQYFHDVKDEVNEILLKTKANSLIKVDIERYVINLKNQRSIGISIPYSDYYSEIFSNADVQDFIITCTDVALVLLETMKMERNIVDVEQRLESQLQINQQLQQEIRSNEESQNLISQFKRDITKLRCTLLQQEVETPTVCILESNKKRWQEQLDAIKELYMKMGPATEINEDIREDYELIEREIDFVHQAKTKEISHLAKTKRTIDIEEIKIPEFNGDVSEWTTFYYLFRKFVHENIMLPKAEKMVWLKSLLDGEPLKLIENLTATEQNYERAWDIIGEKYGDKSILLTNLLDKILDQPNICSRSIEDIKSLLDTTNECMQTLTLSGTNTKDIEPIIARIIIKKLDEEGMVRLECRKKLKGMQLLDDVNKFLEVEHRVLQATQISKFTKENSSIIQLIETISQSTLIQASLSKRQDLLAKFRRTVTSLESIVAELTEGENQDTTTASESD